MSNIAMSFPKSVLFVAKITGKTGHFLCHKKQLQ